MQTMGSLQGQSLVIISRQFSRKLRDNLDTSGDTIWKSWNSLANCIILRTFFSSNPFISYSSCNCRDTVATICFPYSALAPRTSKNKAEPKPRFLHSYVNHATLFFHPSRKPRCDGFRAMLSRNFSRSKVTLRCNCRGSFTLMDARVF